MSQENESIIVEPAAPETEEVVTENQAPEAVAVTDPLESLRLPEDDTIDATYRGKTAKDLIEMHRNATSRIGDQGRELGVWRNLVNELSQNVTQPKTQPVEKEAPALTPEALLTNPQDVLKQYLDREFETRLAPMAKDREREALSREEAQLRADFPNGEKIAADPAFHAWAAAKPGRKADLDRAVQGDMTAGRRLLETWTELHPEKPAPETTQADSDKPQGLAGAKQSVTEAGGQGRATAAGKVYYASEITELIRTNPEKYYSEGFQAELSKAALEGRVRA